MQALQTGQGLRTADGRLIDNATSAPAHAAHADSAPAVETVAQPQHPELDIHRVADAEQLLEELDACGVSSTYPLKAGLGFAQQGGSAELRLSNGVPQVGLIASLKGEHKHDIVEKVRGHGNCSPARLPAGHWQAPRPPQLRKATLGAPADLAPPLLQALVALGCMEHRGACSADDVSGDGAGLMTKIPWELFKAEVPGLSEQNTG